MEFYAKLFNSRCLRWRTKNKQKLKPETSLFRPVNRSFTILRLLIFLRVSSLKHFDFFFSCYLDFVANYVNNITYNTLYVEDMSKKT